MPSLTKQINSLITINLLDEKKTVIILRHPPNWARVLDMTLFATQTSSRCRIERRNPVKSIEFRRLENTQCIDSWCEATSFLRRTERIRQPTLRVFSHPQFPPKDFFYCWSSRQEVGRKEAAHIYGWECLLDSAGATWIAFRSEKRHRIRFTAAGTLYRRNEVIRGTQFVSPLQKLCIVETKW
jgi:hypothetical protein